MKKRRSNITENTNKKKKIIIGISLIAILAIGVGVYLLLQKSPVKENKKEKKKEPVVEKKLTIFDEDSNARPIAVMIDNNVGNKAHAGLQESYLNYEIIVEGGLTRIMAIYKDKEVALIGPVRSSRHYFLDYALESDCIYTHYGWSTYAQNDIQSLGVNNINGLYDSAPFWRDNKIAAPHNVFTSTDKIYSYALDKKYQKTSDNWKVLNYSAEAILLNTPVETKTEVNPETGKKEKVDVPNPELLTANTVNIPYSNSTTRGYTYDATREVYLRTMNGAPHTDKTTSQQLNYKNIIIQKVPNHSLDSYGRQDLETTGTGTGFYITNGYALPINWTKATRSSKTKYTYTNGKTIKINDGNTFVQVVPTASNITIG